MRLIAGFVVLLIVSAAACTHCAADDLAADQKAELIRAAKAGRLWRGSCQKGHKSNGFTVADKQPYGRLGESCDGWVTPSGGGKPNPCPWARRYYKATVEDVEKWFEEQAKARAKTGP
jgi:hypothetical protein